MKTLETITGTLAALALIAACATALGFFWGLGVELARLIV